MDISEFGGRLEPDPLNVKNAHLAVFQLDGAVVTIRVVIKESRNVDLTITHMTVLPSPMKRARLGTAALSSLLKWAMANNLTRILAPQVQEHVAGFWTFNGFRKASGPNPTSDYERVLAANLVEWNAQDDYLLVGPARPRLIKVLEHQGIHLFADEYGLDDDMPAAFRLDGVAAINAAVPERYRPGGRAPLSTLLHEFHRRHPDIPLDAMAEAHLIAANA